MGLLEEARKLLAAIAADPSAGPAKRRERLEALAEYCEELIDDMDWERTRKGRKRLPGEEG